MDVFKQNLIVAIVSLIVGSVLTAIVTRIRNKSAVFRWAVRTERVAVTVDDAVFGSVKVTWQGSEARNLYVATIALENASCKDFENVTVKVYTGDETVLLTEQTGIDGTPYIVRWSREYEQSIRVPEGQMPSPEQRRQYLHSREYTIPVLNRGQRVQFNYVCTRPNDDLAPLVFLSTQTKGVKLKYASSPNVFWNVPVPIAVTWGFAATAIAVALCVLFLKQVWLTAVLCAMVGLFAQIPGALMYKIERRVRAVISE